MSSLSWGPSSRPGDGPSSDSPAASNEKSKAAIAGPGKCLFAVVVPPKDLDPEDVRANVKSALASVPPQYHVIEHNVGAVAFLGDGTPVANSGPAHSPQVLERPEAVVILVSPQLDAADVAEAFVNVCEAHADPKSRAVGLKMKLRELSVEARFSFVLLDLTTARVFCASTALSSPLAMGHAPDGTLLVTCTRSGARAATAWPPRWTSVTCRGQGYISSTATSSSSSLSGGHRGGPKLTWQYGQSPGTAGAPLTPGRSISPATDRSRSRSPSACSTNSSGSGVSEIFTSGSGSGVMLSHLPAGRFVYGRRYLQPFEFSAFWHSAETNRAGARAAVSTDAGEGAAGAGAEVGSPNVDARQSPVHSVEVPSGIAGASGKFASGSPPVHPWSSRASPDAGDRSKTTPGSNDRRKYSSTGSRSDTSASWRTRGPLPPPPHAPALFAPLPKSSSLTPATPATPVTRKSGPVAVPKMKDGAKEDDDDDNNNNTWPGGCTNKVRGVGKESHCDVDPETLMYPFGRMETPPPPPPPQSPLLVAAEEEERRRSTGSGGGAGVGDKVGKWVPRGRWTQGQHCKFRGDGDDVLLLRNALSEGTPNTARGASSELTRALYSCTDPKLASA